LCIQTHKTMEIITWHISIKSIFENNRNIFNIKHKGQIRPNTIKNVEKVLGCWSTMWFASYKCDWCNKVKHINFTCKSRFCNSCSQPQSDIWMNKIISRRPQRLLYNHIIFTMPQELRRFFKDHRKALNILPYTAAHAIMHFLRDQKITPWILAAVHTFWAKLNWNAHTHLIVTHWAIHDNWNFKNNIFLPYKAIGTSRTTYLVKNLRDRTKKNLTWEKCKNELRFINTFYNYHSKISGEKTNRNVHFPEKPNSFYKIVWYIGRYVRRPIIAQSRILAYDWENITYNYFDKKDKIIKEISCSATEFIGLLVQHIPQKNFHMLYYYGIFANRTKQKYLTIIHNFFNQPKYTIHIPKSFAERIFLFTGKNPLQCNCWWIFHKFKLSIPWYPNILYDTS